MRVNRRTATHAVQFSGSVGVICVAGVLAPGRDPSLLLELVVATTALLWAGIGARNVIRARSLRVALDRRAVAATVGDVPCAIVAGGGRRALVLGTVRPRIYVGDALPVALEPDELEAVVLHEEHHRRTRAPLRAAALEAWLVLFGRVARVRGALIARLADLEAEADRFAVNRGATPAALARALVKSEPLPTPGAAAFASASDRRMRHLLALADHSPRALEAVRFAAPYEWLPLALGLGALFACHLMGLPFA